MRVDHRIEIHHQPAIIVIFNVRPRGRLPHNWYARGTNSRGTMPAESSPGTFDCERVY